MIDIRLLREEKDRLKEAIAAKQVDPVVVDKALELDQKWRDQLKKVEYLRAERNEVAEQMKEKLSEEERQKLIEKGKNLKETSRIEEEELNHLEIERNNTLNEIPNPSASDVPFGKGEEDNVELRKWGDIVEFDFTPKDHLEIGTQLDILDFDRGSKVSGSGFYYLKNDGALLEVALTMYGLEFLTKKGFTPFITPDLARERYYLGTGYQPKGDEAQIYEIENSDLGLIATAEVTLAGYHADEVLNGKEFPKRYAGYSRCFRQEAGAYGKYSKGLYRVHQFTKVEMFIYCLPEESEKMHQELLSLEEEFWQSLGVPYRVLEMCTGDLGAIAAKKYDLEAWMPGRGDWGEITSTSNTTDYQSRNLNIKYQKDGQTEYAHLLNGTLVATSRGIISILENYQQKDGSVLIPEVLQKYMGKDKISSF